MFHLLIDTCVWLDLAKDHKQQSLLSALEELARAHTISLIVPRLVVDEFARNKARIIEESRQSLSGTFKRVKEAVEKFGDPKRKNSVLEQLNEVDRRLPTIGDTASGTVARIGALFNGCSIIEVPDAV